MSCKVCERDLYMAFEKMQYIDTPFIESKLPEYPMPNVTLPINRLKEFNVDYHALAEFAALVCGVKVETLCKMDMMLFLKQLEAMHIKGDDK